MFVEVFLELIYKMKGHTMSEDNNKAKILDHVQIEHNIHTLKNKLFDVSCLVNYLIDTLNIEERVYWPFGSEEYEEYKKKFFIDFELSK
ncbi:MAG: hypothetical protein WAM24_07125 [Ignavibacteriaceae bacterium]